MAKRTIEITLKIAIHDFTKAERDEESLEKDDCAGAVDEFDANDLAEALADHIESEQDELLAGSDAYVKIASVKATVNE